MADQNASKYEPLGNFFDNSWDSRWWESANIFRNLEIKNNEINMPNQNLNCNHKFVRT